jgi:hypothetical protein
MAASRIFKLSVADLKRLWHNKTPAVDVGRFRLSKVPAYFSGDSVFEPEPAGPMVVFGAGPS